MKQFSEWALNFIPTILLMLMITLALFGANDRIVNGFMGILASANIMTGFFSHLTKSIGFILGAS